MAGPITADQRRALFAAGRARGMGIEELRAMTPGGSISALSRSEASRLLERLNSGTAFEHPRHRSPRLPRNSKGVYRLATDAQRGMIEFHRIELGWTAEKLSAWLSERHYRHGGPMNTIRTTADAGEVIELLKGVLARTLKARETRAATG